MSNIGHEELEVESIVESQGSNSSRKRKAYSIEKKLEAIDYAKKFKSKKAASDKFGISRSTVQDWVKQEEELRVMSKNSKRLAGAGRHLTFAELDVELANWVREQKAGKKKVSRRILKQQAVKIFVQDDEICGITNATDGSEDDQIHCFQRDGSVPTGRVKLQRARNDKELAELLEEIDLEEEQGMFDDDSDVSLDS
uniref:HTH psq-type domain-containing protein n=1 Tax=Ditylenchus dipsaci TaxID=166011 RepID=A0A915E2Y6_9BILA